MSKNIHDIFSEWGKTQRQVPENNTVFKQKILANVSIVKSSKSVPWLSLAFAGLAILALVVKWPTSNVEVNTTAPKSMAESRNLYINNGLTESTALDVKHPAYYPYSEPSAAPIADKREFLKTDYRAHIKSRQPDEQARRIQLTIRGLGGRVDSFTTSDEYGYVSFVLPADKLDEFRDEIKTLAPARFIRQTVSGTNILPQVRMLEEQKKSDQQLLDAVSTVQGTITLEWISVWGVIDLYLGSYWLALLLALAALGSYLAI